MIKKITTTRKGFTLIELLVSISIFVIFLGVVSMAYIGIVRSQRQADNVRKMYSDVRSLIESLSEDMRLGTIDYDCYSVSGSASSDPNSTNYCPSGTIIAPLSSSPDKSPYLAIVNKDNTLKTVYWFDKTAGKIKVKKYQGTLTNVDNIDIAQWSEVPGYTHTSDTDGTDETGSRSLLSDMVTVKNLTFSVNPPVNPYASENYAKNQYQFQPKVTLTLSVENADKNIPPFHLNFQTTLSSRVYSRSKS